MTVNDLEVIARDFGGELRRWSGGFELYPPPGTCWKTWRFRCIPVRGSEGRLEDKPLFCFIASGGLAKLDPLRGER